MIMMERLFFEGDEGDEVNELLFREASLPVDDESLDNLPEGFVEDLLAAKAAENEFEDEVDF